MTVTTATATPSSQPTTADVSTALWTALADIDVLVAKGDKGQALRRARRILDHGDGAARAELADLIANVEQARDADWQPPQPAGRRRYVPASRVQVRRAAPRPVTGGRDDGAAAADAYRAEQEPAPVEPGGWDEPVWGKRVDDFGALVAMVPLTGGPCLHCRLERTPADLANPDGLCADCRDAGLTRESAIRARCADITARAGAHARVVLRAAWTHSRRPADQAVIAAWVAEHTALLAPATAD
jgi:hypothetical protein